MPSKKLKPGDSDMYNLDSETIVSADYHASPKARRVSVIARLISECDETVNTTKMPDGPIVIRPLQVDPGTYLVYDHAVTNNVVGAVWVGAGQTVGTVTTWYEYVMVRTGANYPFKAQTTGGTVRYRRDNTVNHATYGDFYNWAIGLGVTGLDQNSPRQLETYNYNSAQPMEW